MFRIIKNFNWIILSSFLCIFMGIVTFLTFINQGFVTLTDKNLQTLLIIDIFLLLVFFGLIFRNFYRFYYTGKKNKKGAQTNLKYISIFSLFTVMPSLIVAIFSLFIFNFGIQNYFEKFTSREGAGVSLQEESLVLEDWGQEGYGATGLYEFFYMENGMQVRHPARFSFMVKSDPTQKIQHHHSSLIPDS